MYSVYVRGRYDVQYKWVLLRIVIQNGFFHLAYLAHLLPPKYIWIQSTGLRLALVCIILEVVYYLACLRNTRYAVEDFRCLRYLCIYGGIMFTLGSVLPVLNPLARNMDQFNAAILFLWGLGIEILGPPLWDLFRSYMEWQYEFVECNVLETFSDNIKDALDDPLLYPIILSCAQKRFCDENIKFLHGGYSILTTVVNLQNDNKPSDCSLEDRVNELLKTYVVVGASTPVNLASKHLTKFRQIHAELNSAGDRHLDLAKLEIVLSQSLRDIFELLDSSGVLTMYNKSPEKIVIDAERAALIRLEAGSY
ncbi:hypothetical protein SARC_12285 [Sphaeroforma arctica JP610]|uniref:RGS domain-containing protein n=1 Tax=Sphaeroforma arctica JP610 TaxID=667725 RepID=A0A0L0FEJ4_9EUKA|nr:hypothetical protein SARC_12285 [Sphaeroforma arctica JP610]KNC75184.1 hypothetical protein SARC_12285 [Sphaeroforma arctica JP610]|eukprot:XP_014149086.1 hypothetical protein SARC_12285 [Sphaeroforma arctica JP610]